MTRGHQCLRRRKPVATCRLAVAWDGVKQAADQHSMSRASERAFKSTQAQTRTHARCASGCNSAISAIGTGDWRCALDCFRQLTVFLECPGIRDSNSLRHSRRSLDLRGLREVGSRPDAVSFGSGMAAAASGSWGLALALGASSGSCPDLAQRNIVLAECSWRPALALLGCREASLQPNGITYSNAVKTLAKDARWRDSFTLIGVLACML